MDPKTHPAPPGDIGSPAPMDLDTYFATPGALTVSQLRKAINAKSDDQVRQWQHRYKNRRPNPAYCVAIEIATNGLVTRQTLRDDWEDIWAHLPALPKRTESQ